MKKLAKLVLLRSWAVLRIIVAAALLLPILLGFLWFNYTVDRASYFQGDAFVRDIADMLLAGNAVSGYEQMDERQVSKLIVQNVAAAPKLVALGSSRILQLDSKGAGTNDFFNFGMVGADYMDVIGTYYLFQKAEKLPQNIVIGFDPWYLNGAVGALDKRSDKRLYAEFLTNELGRKTDFRPEDDSDKYKALLSIGYFQGNVQYYFRDKNTEKKPEPVIGDIMSQPTEIKEADGSVLYTEKYRNYNTEETASIAMQQALTFMRMNEYTEPSADLLRIFADFFNLLHSKNINVAIVLQPFHPAMWDNVFARAEEYPGFFKTEAAVRKLAAECDVPVYGSYNPYALEGIGIGEKDFFDGLHAKREALARIFPGVDAMAQACTSGDFPKEPDYTALKPNPKK